MSVLILGGLLVLGLVGYATIASGAPGVRAFHGPANVRVPVDDFVMGDLPMVCARTGRDADGLVEFRSDESGFQAWWLLLLFLGPFGIVGIVILAAISRPARVSGLLPLTHDALAQHNRLTSISDWAWAVPFVALLGGAGLLFAPSVLGFSSSGLGAGVLALGLVGGFLVMGIASLLIRSRTVRVRLDGSGRWIELRNTHPTFAAAADRQNRVRHRARNARREGRES